MHRVVQAQEPLIRKGQGMTFESLAVCVGPGWFQLQNVHQNTLRISAIGRFSASVNDVTALLIQHAHLFTVSIHLHFPPD
jgi:hypothetical protein